MRFLWCFILSIFLYTSCFSEQSEDLYIFKFKKELSITDEQEKHLHDLITKLQNLITIKNQELRLHSEELNRLILEKSDLNIIKTKLQTIAMLQAEANFEDISTARDIEKTLSLEQLEKWQNMQKTFNVKK